MYVPMGEFETCAAGERARDGSYLVYNPPGTWHADRRVDPGPFFSIAINGDIECNTDRLPREPTALTRASQHAIVRRLMRVCADSDNGHAEALVLELLGATATSGECERKPPRWLASVIDAMQTIPRDLTAGDLARIAGVHPVHLARTFRAFFGCTPAEYIRTQRCHRAARLLSATRKPLAEVALLAGFADQSHFTKAFRQATGATPAAYRRITTH